MKFTVPIYYQQTKKKKVLVGLNWYRNAHFQVLNNAKKRYGWLIKPQMMSGFKFTKKVHIHYDIYLKRKGSDGGNVRSIIEKFVLDAFVKNGLIKDDNFEIVISDSACYYHDKDNPRAEITIR